MVSNRSNSTPKLSIVTVTFNAEDSLEFTLQSIFGQTFGDYELIVVDGGSTDRTLAICEQYSDRISCLITEPDRGIYDAMNKGLTKVNGEYVQFLNSGDYYADPDVLADMFSDLSESPSLIYGDIIVVNTNGKEHRQLAGTFDKDSLLRRGTGVLCHQAMFVKSAIAPSYDRRFKYKGELNWYFDILETPQFNAVQKNRDVVYYTLGGVGHKNFIHNRLEWVWLIFRRFGLKTVIDSRIIGFLLHNSLSRYPKLRKGINGLNRIRSRVGRSSRQQ